MNLKLKEIFRGKVVNEADTINTGVDGFPRCLLEYLIDNCCFEETFREDMEGVVRRLKDSYVYGAEVERIRHCIRENRQHTIDHLWPRSATGGDGGQVLGKHLRH